MTDPTPTIETLSTVMDAYALHVDGSGVYVAQRWALGSSVICRLDDEGEGDVLFESEWLRLTFSGNEESLWAAATHAKGGAHPIFEITKSSGKVVERGTIKETPRALSASTQGAWLAGFDLGENGAIYYLDETGAKASGDLMTRDVEFGRHGQFHWYGDRGRIFQLSGRGNRELIYEAPTMNAKARPDASAPVGFGSRTFFTDGEGAIREITGQDKSAIIALGQVPRLLAATEDGVWWMDESQFVKHAGFSSPIARDVVRLDGFMVQPRVWDGYLYWLEVKELVLPGVRGEPRETSVQRAKLWD